MEDEYDVQIENDSWKYWIDDEPYCWEDDLWIDDYDVELDLEDDFCEIG